jgi:hypothetical protein
MQCVETGAEGEDDAHDIFESENGIVSYLDQYVAIEEDVTIGDFISILASQSEEIDYIFDASLNGQSLGIFVEELEQESIHDGALAFVEVVHDVELNPEGVVSEIKYFQGIGPSPADGRLTSFSLELLPLNYYKDLPLRINHNYVIERIEKVKDVPMHFIEFKALKGFTLYEVIHSILFEISFHGTPSERGEVLAEILEMCEQATGETLALPAAAEAGKEAETARLNEELSAAIEREDYERAAVLRDKLKDIGGDR